MYLISDNVDTLIGMRLAGVEGMVVHTAPEVKQALEDVLRDKTVDIILMTEKLAALIPKEVEEVKLRSHSHILVEIPDRHGTIRPPDSITAYVRDAIGLKI